MTDSRPSALRLKEIVQPVLVPLNEVEERLERVGAESEGILQDASRYVLLSGGKRLRAALVLFCASVGNGTHPDILEPAIEIATAVELIHSATLVHDDIIDHAVLRRLKPTVNVRFGEEVAVLLGDFLYARAFEMIARVGNPDITTWMARTTRQMCEGEIDQLRHRFRADLTLDAYLSFIERKTATLISVCGRSGARLARLPAEQENALGSFGLCVGISFQIVDDLLDIVGVEQRLGKPTHADLGNGKMTLPLILLVEALSGEERRAFVENLQSASPDWKSIQKLLERHQIVEQTERFSNEYFVRANQALQTFPPKVRIPLENLSRFVLGRDY